MADDLDIATETHEIFMRASLEARREQGPVETGFCLNCEEPLSPGKRWCDCACRDDWEMEFNGGRNGG